MKKWAIVVVAAATVCWGAAARQSDRLPLARVSIALRGDFREIVANGIPDHPTGNFPNRGNPNRITEQQHRFRVPVNPRPSATQARGILFGVALNGIPFDPGTAELWNNNPQWHYEALSGLLGSSNRLGVDRNRAHVQPDGTYHYHGLPTALLERLGADKRMIQIGWAADGYPIYGNIGPTDPVDPNSPLRPMRSSYRLKSGNRPAGDGPQGIHDGSFAQDFEYVPGSGDLDQHNGRTGSTPEFPKGTYYYVLTDTFPYVPRSLKGIPDESFRKGPGDGRQRVDGGVAPGSTATNGRHWFVLRNGILYQYEVESGLLIGKIALPAGDNR